MPYNIYTLNPNSKTKVVLQSLVHGNEKIGKIILDEVKQIIENKELHTELVFLESNLRAYQENKRYIDTDLNRQLSKANIEKLEQKDLSTLSHEEKLAIDLSYHLYNADFLLDIHATRFPTKPFIYSANTAQHLDIISALDVELVVLSDSESDLMGSTDEFVDSYGGVGFTLEAGGVNDYQYKEKMVNLVVDFLVKVGTLQPKNHSFKNTHKKFTSVRSFKAPSNDFTLAKQFKNFDILKKGDLIGKSGDKFFYAKQEAIIIFTYPVKSGETCLVFGVERSL